MPELNISQSKIKTPTRIFRSTHIQYKKTQSIGDFYRTRYHAKIKSLTKVSSFPMVEAPRKINYFLAQHIDELNINAFRNLVFEGAVIRAIAYIGNNLSTSCAEIYSPETTLKMKVINALRILACIPMFFKAVKHKQSNQEHVFVNGGLCWSCPIELFDYKKYLDNPLNTRVRRKIPINNQLAMLLISRP